MAGNARKQESVIDKYRFCSGFGVCVWMAYNKREKVYKWRASLLSCGFGINNW